MIIGNGIENKRLLIEAIATGEIKTSQIKPLHETDTSRFKALFDSEDIYIMDCTTASFDMLKAVLDLYNEAGIK